jgi:regulator of protease activity HflC (stomatin/prohibitin superfamily)
MTAVLIVLVMLVVLLLSLAGSSVRVLREYERGVVFRFGRLVAKKGPGLCSSCQLPTAWCGSRWARSRIRSRRRT